MRKETFVAAREGVRLEGQRKSLKKQEEISYLANQSKEKKNKKKEKAPGLGRRGGASAPSWRP